MIVKNDRRQFLKVAGLGALAITLGIKSKPNPNWVAWGNVRSGSDLVDDAYNLDRMMRWISDTLAMSLDEDEPVTLDQFKQIAKHVTDHANCLCPECQFALEFNPDESDPIEERYVFNVTGTIKPPRCASV
jgi:hypothetical protein